MADITVDDLTVDLLTRFDNFLHKWENEREPGKLLHPNTIEVQFNILRTLVHRAIEVGIMEASKDPFLVFKYKGVKTTKEKLSDTEMERIIALELEEGSLIWHCKNYFLFSYYCAGIRAADLIQLRWRNVTENGRLHYQMGKNHKDRDLVLVEQALEILGHYHREEVKPDDYIFPLLDNDAPFAKFVTQADKDRMKPELRHQLYQQISAKNALINKYLKKLQRRLRLLPISQCTSAVMLLLTSHKKPGLNHPLSRTFSGIAISPRPSVTWVVSTHQRLIILCALSSKEIWVQDGATGGS